MAQISFSRLFGNKCGTDAEAKAKRNAAYKALRADGFTAVRWVCKGQLKKYESFGVPDGRSCDVYMIDTNADWTTAKQYEARDLR